MLFYTPCTESGNVRLVGGTSNCNGLLEMKHQGEWRAALAWFDWDRMSSSVVCRQLGCGSAVSTEFTSISPRQAGWLIPSSCVGSETSLMECGPVKSYDSTLTLKLNCSGKTGSSTTVSLATISICLSVLHYMRIFKM